MFCREGGKLFLQESTIEIRVVGSDEYHPVEPIVDGMMVDAATGDHFIGNAGDIRDLGRDRKPRIFKPFP